MSSIRLLAVVLLAGLLLAACGGRSPEFRARGEAVTSIGVSGHIK